MVEHYGDSKLQPVRDWARMLGKVTVGGNLSHVESETTCPFGTYDNDVYTTGRMYDETIECFAILGCDATNPSKVFNKRHSSFTNLNTSIMRLGFWAGKRMNVLDLGVLRSVSDGYFTSCRLEDMFLFILKDIQWVMKGDTITDDYLAEHIVKDLVERKVQGGKEWQLGPLPIADYPTEVQCWIGALQRAFDKFAPQK